MMSSIFKKIALVVASTFCLLVLIATPAHAQNDNPVGGGGGGITNPLSGVNSIQDLFVNFTQWLLGLVGILAVLGVVYGGVRMVVSVGDEGQLASAKKIVMWSIVGLVVAILALTIVNIVAVDWLGVGRGGVGAGAGDVL